MLLYNIYLARVSKAKTITQPKESGHQVPDVGKTYTHECVGRGTDQRNPAVLDHYSWASQLWISQTGGRVFNPSFLGEFLTTPKHSQWG